MRATTVLIAAALLCACTVSTDPAEPDAILPHRTSDPGRTVAVGDARPDGGVDANSAPPSDSEVLLACDTECPGEQLIAWPEDTTPEYNICLPSYRHCCLTPQCQ